ncbi:MAG: eukaryotic-like serine/threonine-protein kinase [Blastocatellia bacterium]|jgi:serine/threonine-protein kinase|nr:eukaryotic-like serine/threonine-protein kinase [Blastocatellia bacterium]
MIGAKLGNYRILEKIGAGGQGTVYKAADTKLGRAVVVKVLPPELTVKEANLKRFEREARLASALDHPNICTIFDLNDIDGVHFIAMQYVEGKNVRDLVNGRPLDLRSALSICIQVADALDAAHGRGIIHRDIKAGNVMVTPSGQVKVLDFGLAKLMDGDSAGPGGIHHTDLTEIGIPYGTATYAAPEQARGDKVDARADIFSTGVLLYEMLTGTWPFQGKTSVDVRHAVLHDDPEPLSEARPGGAPPQLQLILDRTLAKDPKQRYQKVGELRDDLRAVLREVEAGGAQGFEPIRPVAPRHLSGTGRMGRALRWLRSVTGERTATQRVSTSERPAHETPVTSVADRERKSVAILPFKNLSNDSASSFYEFSLADAVITELARVRSLVVRPSSEIVKYQGVQVDPRQAGRDMSVAAVLSAGFLRAGDRIRVTAQLVDVESGDLLWSDKIDADATDIINVQDTITQEICDGLRLELTSDEKVWLEQPKTANAEAYDEYLRGRDCMGRYVYHTIARKDVDEAIEHFQTAAYLDPSFALAHSALGGAYANRVMKGFGEAGDHAHAEAAFQKALALDPHLLEARMHMVFIYMARGDKEQARRTADRLKQEAPNDVGVHFARGVLARLDGDYNKSLRSFDRMARLNPAERVVVSYNRARLLTYQGRYDEALAELDAGAAVEPDHPLIRTFRARALYYRGEPVKAAEILEQVLEQQPQLDGIRPIYATFLSALGWHDEAREQITDEVIKTADTDHDVAYWLASAYAMEGERDAAFKWLTRAIELGNENRPWFERDRNWDSLRDDPEYQRIVSSIVTPISVDEDGQ